MRGRRAPNIACGPLSGPAKVGRVPEYTAEHVVRLARIKRLQADGHKLLVIGRILSGPSAKKSVMERPSPSGAATPAAEHSPPRRASGLNLPVSPSSI